MLTVRGIKKMCEAPGAGKAYYRPFICRGDLSRADIFFVGTNPATPITPEDMDLDEYVELLLDYERFIEFYKKSRISRDKSELSRTRIGMNSFLKWLSKHTALSIIETDVISYPAEKLKHLRKEPKQVIERGKDIFYELVVNFKPKLLILHGKETVEQAADVFCRSGILSPGSINLDQAVDEMEKQVPLIEFTYPDNKTGIIVACRHFMYYGSTGDSFKEFREKLLSIVDK